MDLEQAEERLKRGEYGGVLYAHTYGELSTPDEFFQFVKTQYPDLLLVDDRCLCIPDLDPPKETSADVMLYSTGYAKIVELGFGGYAFLKTDTAYNSEHLPFESEANEELEKGYKQAIRNHEPYIYRDSDWLQTDADLPSWYDYRQQIKDGLKLSLQQRAAINEIYVSNLPVEIQLPQVYQTWRFNLRLQNKSRVLETIFSNGLFASSHYASMAGIMTPGQCPQAEGLANEIINLFNDHRFMPEKARQICAVIMEKLN